MSPPAIFGRSAGRPLVFGHRGAAAIATENTLASIRAAALAGADGVEIDVRPSRDGVAIVFHDRTLARLAGRPEALRALGVDALRAVRVGGEPIPTLAEVLESTGDLLVNIEIKDDARLGDAAFAAHIVAVVRRCGAERRVLLSCFNPATLLRVRAIAPALPTGLLFAAGHRQGTPRRLGWGSLLAPPRLPVEWTRPLVRPFSLHPEASLVTAPRLGRWHREGYAVFAWTVDDAEELRRLTRLGVDGIITNDPARAIAALREEAA
ncbi:MAG: glycerophosphodiester phosphodiesterase [Myxococcota bacterium]